MRRVAEGLEAVLVTEELVGFRALSEFPPLVPALNARLARAVGTELGKLHGARLQHGGLYDKHVMVRWEDEKDVPEVALIDLETMRARLTASAARRRDLEQFKRRQKVFGEAEWPLLLHAHGEAMKA